MPRDEWDAAQGVNRQWSSAVSFSGQRWAVTAGKVGICEGNEHLAHPIEPHHQIVQQKMDLVLTYPPEISLFYGAGRLLVCLALLAVLLVCGAEANTRAGES
jgi:hypothetical protein